MSLIPGNFTETALQDIRVESSQLMMDEMTKLQYEPSSLDIIKTVQAVQTAQVNTLFSNNKKDNKVELIDLHACGLEVTDLTGCIPSDAPKLSSTAKEFEITQSEEVSFQIDENDLRPNVFTFEQAMAKGMLACEARIIESIQAYMIAVLNGGVGENSYTGGKGSVVGSDTYIDPALWDASLYPYLITVMKKNRFKNAAFLTGHSAFYESMIAAMLNGANANGPGEVAAFKSLPTFYDLEILPEVNTPDNISYMLALGSVAFASKQTYDTVVEENSDHSRFSYMSSIVPGLWFNVLTERVCSNNFTTQKTKMFAKHDLFTNPTGCDNTRTGILSFTCDTVS